MVGAQQSAPADELVSLGRNAILPGTSVASALHAVSGGFRHSVAARPQSRRFMPYASLKGVPSGRDAIGNGQHARSPREFLQRTRLYAQGPRREVSPGERAAGAPPVPAKVVRRRT